MVTFPTNDTKNLSFIYQPEKPSEPYHVSSCNRSKSLEEANDDLLYLNNIYKVRGCTRISGVIEEDGTARRNLQYLSPP